MVGLRQELLICGDNQDIVMYLSKASLKILESAKDVKNIQVSTTKMAQPNVTINYTLHPAGQSWLNREGELENF